MLRRRVVLCLEAIGCLTSGRTLIKFFESNGLSLSKQRPEIGYPAEVKKLRARRGADGKWTPLGYTSAQTRPDLLNVVPGLAAPKRRIGVYDDDRVLAATVQFVRDRRGCPQTRRDYLKWAAEQGDAPAASSMNSNGCPGFAAYREQARRIVREEEKRTAVGRHLWSARTSTPPKSPSRKLPIVHGSVRAPNLS